MGRIKRLLASALVVIIATVGTVAITSAPASASPACWSGYLCLWEHSYGGGSEIDYSSGFRGQCVNLPWNWHDKVSSMTNNIGGSVDMYINANCTGASLWVTNGSGWDNLAWAVMNDSIDSIRIY
jgi:peptidase inhibitor family I36